MRRRGPTSGDPAPFLAALGEILRAADPPGPECVQRLAATCDIPVAELAGMLAFWESCDGGGREPRGCDGPVCALLGRPGTPPGNRSCPGQCASGPLVAEGLEAGPGLRSAPPGSVFAPGLEAGAAAAWRALAALRQRGVAGALETCAELELPGAAGQLLSRQVRTVCARAAVRRHVVVNAAGAEPGILHERLLLARGSGLVLEGALVAAHLVGAADVILCLPASWREVPPALDAAWTDVSRSGLLGIGGLSPRLHLRQVPGAFVCRESSALLAALEGCMPWPRDDIEATGSPGLWEQPTLMLAVQNAARLPLALVAAWDSRTDDQAGDRAAGSLLVSLSGGVQRPGVHEVRTGTSLRSLLAAGAAGTRQGDVRACTTGGLTGGLLGPEELEFPLRAADPRSEGFIVLDEGADLPAFMRAVLAFFSRESCGRCLPCRAGSVRVEHALGGRPLAGPGLADTLEVMGQASACSVGRDGARLVGELLEHFPGLRSGGDRV